MGFQLCLRRERSIRVDLEADSLMPRKVGLYKRRADSCEWIEHDAWAVREASEGIFDEVL